MIASVVNGMVDVTVQIFDSWEKIYFNLLADLLMDHPSCVPEKTKYINLLQAYSATAMDVISIVEKFGTEEERKLVSHARRKFCGTSALKNQRCKVLRNVKIDSLCKDFLNRHFLPLLKGSSNAN
jgi:hypothetical protein